jgi:hypothetical protein
MRKRNVRCQLWLYENEAERFNRHVKRSGLSREGYLRQLINGLVPTDAPPPDYFAMMQELRRIGAKLDQIAQTAHMLHTPDAERYNETAAMLDKAVITITNAVMLPRKIERKRE